MTCMEATWSQLHGHNYGLLRLVAERSKMPRNPGFGLNWETHAGAACRVGSGVDVWCILLHLDLPANHLDFLE